MVPRYRAVGVVAADPAFGAVGNTADAGVLVCFGGRWRFGMGFSCAFDVWLTDRLSKRGEVRGRHGEVWRLIDGRMLRWCEGDGGRNGAGLIYVCERSMVSEMLSVE